MSVAHLERSHTKTRSVAFNPEEATLRVLHILSKELRNTRLSRIEVRVFLLGNKKLRLLKKEWLHKDVPFVDVLAFPEPEDFPHPESKKKCLGEIYINKSIARADATRAIYLLIHGILHLLGYRHEKRNDMISMERMERFVLERFFR